jgi:hypothetical protein
MTKEILLFTSMAFAHAPAHSQTATTQEGTITIAPSIVSAYMDRGVYLSGLSFQPAVEYSKGELNLELFSSFPISDKIYGTSDPQIDFTASYAWNIGASAFTMTPSILLSTFPRANADEGFYKATCESSVTFECAITDYLSLSLGFYYDLVMKGGGYEFGVDFLLPLKPIGIDVEFSVLAGRYDMSDTEANAPIKVRNIGDYFHAGASVPFKLSDKSKLALGWGYAKGTHNHVQVGEGEMELNPHAIGRGFFTLAFSQTF